MKQFLKFTLATAAGLMLGVFSIIIIVSIATSGGSKEVQLDEPHVLRLELNGEIQDRVEEMPFDLSEITGQDVNILGLNDILANIKKAKTDTLPMPSSFEELKERPEAKNLINIYSSVSELSLEKTIHSFSKKTTLHRRLFAC